MNDHTEAITSIIHTHFTAHQHEHPPTKRTSATLSLSPSSLRSAASLRDELNQHILSSNLVDLSLSDGQPFDAANVIANTFIHIVDCAVCALHNNKEAMDATHSTLELVCAYSSFDQNLSMAIVERAIEYSVVSKDLIRVEACEVLSFHLGQFLSVPSSILKGKRGGKGVNNVMEEWKVECAIKAGKALLMRMTDKITRVRCAAVSACGWFFKCSVEKNEELREVAVQMEECLLWLASNDSSAANRALALSCLPVGEENIAAVVDRLKDVDVKVREAALEALREKVALDDLGEEVMVEILRNGLTKRCQTTHAKTVELLICNWMKTLKYDPIALLDKLNPVINESECEKAIKVILEVAQAIDCDNGDKSIELIQKHFGAPEIREFQQIVTKKLSIVQEEEEDLTPSLVFFLRVKCAVIADMPSSNKADIISDIIQDIPTLCNILNGHLHKLIEFNKLEDDELDMDEDEAAAFEDDQNFICLQLIYMAKASELQEEGSRRHFNSIMRSMLSRLETPDDLVDACVKAMAAAHDTEAQFLQTISEVLVDVEDDDTFGSPGGNAKAKAIVRQMRVIAILSIVLENISSHMVGHPILDGFFEHLSPAITSKNAVVREHGVICLSKFCLLSEQEKVNDQFRPLLMTIASSADERAEVRAQAAMALCDLALIHGDMLNSTEDDENESSTSFKDLLIEMLGHSKPLIVAIAAEISAKLHLAGRFHDPILVGWLVVVFFDSSMLESDESDDNNNAKEIGSAVRLQQLLSMFFPAYSMSSLDANDAIMASVGPLLEIVNFKMEGMKQKKALEQWPISKMVEYICYIVDMADKTKKSEDKAEVDEEPENDLMEPTETDSLAGEDAKEKDDKNIIEASSILLASIDIAEYLAESSSRIPAFYTRAVAKILGSASIDVSAEDKALLKRLKTQVTEAEYSIDDGPSLTAIRKLSKVLENVDDEEEEADTSEGEEAEEIAEKMEKVSLVDREKENPRLSTGTVGSQLSSKSRGRESTSSRVSLGSLN
ncbi:hypothetical protein ACHAXN_012667 [Cyclotella atomus]